MKEKRLLLSSFKFLHSLSANKEPFCENCKHWNTNFPIKFGYCQKTMHVNTQSKESIKNEISLEHKNHKSFYDWSQFSASWFQFSTVGISPMPVLKHFSVFECVDRHKDPSLQPHHTYFFFLLLVLAKSISFIKSPTLVWGHSFIHSSPRSFRETGEGEGHKINVWSA